MHVKYIAPKTAFELYGKRWAYVDTAKSGNKEKQLIKFWSNAIIGEYAFKPLDNLK